MYFGEHFISILFHAIEIRIQHNQYDISETYNGNVGCNTVNYAIPFLYSDWLYLLAWHKDYSYHLGMSTGDLVKARSPSEFLLNSGVGLRNTDINWYVHSRDA